MYQVWMNDRLYGSWPEQYMAHEIVAELKASHPAAKVEIRINGKV